MGGDLSLSGGAQTQTFAEVQHDPALPLMRNEITGTTYGMQSSLGNQTAKVKTCIGAHVHEVVLPLLWKSVWRAFQCKPLWPASSHE